jgi:hypothetical protein
MESIYKEYQTPFQKEFQLELINSLKKLTHMK